MVAFCTVRSSGFRQERLSKDLSYPRRTGGRVTIGLIRAERCKHRIIALGVLLFRDLPQSKASCRVVVVKAIPITEVGV